MIIDNQFELGEEVYLKTDEEQRKRIITGIKIDCTGGIWYELSLGTNVSNHYAVEISREKCYEFDR